ncbi:ribosome maturation factor [Niabella insulamsoli]|uniref:ribosome maturation factor n=1 Tax=Niabella insulamsoli TaxID=3144874 RepID=UPI0031FCEC63
MEAVLQQVENEMLEILSGNPEHFLVEIKVKPTNNLKIFIDGDKGVGIDDLVRYNRALYKVLEEGPLFPDGDFSLEVSSPGLGEPLKMHRQYQKNTGRFVEVDLKDGSKIEGQLAAVEAAEITVVETKGRGKKAETIEHKIGLGDIKSTQVQIKF